MSDLHKVLDKAVQLAKIASNWHLDEVEIDGEMVDIYDLWDEFKQALTMQSDRADRALLREALAEHAHEAWSGWMRYMFEKCETRHGYFSDEPVVTIPGWAVERWRRQMNMRYADLPENEKESDRLEADRIIEIWDKTPKESQP